jgi:hypothetical protein
MSDADVLLELRDELRAAALAIGDPASTDAATTAPATATAAAADTRNAGPTDDDPAIADVSAVDAAPVPTPRSAPARAQRWLAAAAVLAVVGVALVARPEPAAAGVQVVVAEDQLSLYVTDRDTTPEQIESAAAAAGLDLRVVPVPVGPSNVGRFVGASGSELPAGFELVERESTDGFTGFRVPLDFEGWLELQMGRSAEPGEEWAVLSDVTAPGERFPCEELVGRPLREVLDRLTPATSAEVRVMLLDEARWLDAEELAAHGAATTVRVSSRGPDELWVDVAADATRFSPAEHPPSRCRPG